MFENEFFYHRSFSKIHCKRIQTEEKQVLTLHEWFYKGHWIAAKIRYGIIVELIWVALAGISNRIHLLFICLEIMWKVLYWRNWKLNLVNSMSSSPQKELVRCGPSISIKPVLPILLFNNPSMTPFPYNILFYYFLFITLFLFFIYNFILIIQFFSKIKHFSFILIYDQY